MPFDTSKLPGVFQDLFEESNGNFIFPHAFCLWCVSGTPRWQMQSYISPIASVYCLNSILLIFSLLCIVGQLTDLIPNTDQIFLRLYLSLFFKIENDSRRAYASTYTVERTVAGILCFISNQSWKIYKFVRKPWW